MNEKKKTFVFQSIVVLVDIAEDIRTTTFQKNFEIKCSTGRRVRSIKTARRDIVSMNVDRWFCYVDKTSFQWIKKTSRRFVSTTDAFRSAFAKQKTNSMTKIQSQKTFFYLTNEPGTVIRCSVIARNKRETTS